MASSVLRNAVLAVLVATPGLETLGYTEEVILPNFTPDAPQGDRFMVLRWGVTTPGLAQVNQVRLAIWAYNRQPDYGPISDALKLVTSSLAKMAGIVMAPGESVLAVRSEGESDDLYDDGYRAYTRWCSHLITASGS